MFFAEQCFEYVKYHAQEENIPLKIPDPKLFTHQIPLLIECLMTIMYHDNLFLDQKNNLESHQIQINMNLGGQLLRSRTMRYIMKYMDEQYKCDIMYYYVERALEYVEQGQYIAKNFNTHDFFIKSKRFNTEPLAASPSFGNAHLDEFTAMKEHRQLIDDIKKDVPQHANYLEIYFRRLYLISSSLFRLTAELIMNLLDYQGAQRKNIIAYSEGYGMLMQIVNDNVDFIKDRGTLHKSSDDVQNDLRNATITLPLIYHAGKNSNGYIEKYLASRNTYYIDGQHNHILKEIIQSGALPRSVYVGERWAKHTFGFLHRHGSKKTAPKCYKNLADMLNIARRNRYYKHLDKAQDAYSKGKFYLCKDFCSSKRQHSKGKQTAPSERSTMGTTTSFQTVS
ncbi:MAG: polyprenyl synthetase family protein [Bacteroidota bacterium]